MRDRVAEVLAERTALERGPGTGIFVSAALHAGLIALLMFTATRASKPIAASMVQIQFAGTPSPPAPSVPAARAKPAEVAPPKIVEPKPEPKINEPKPAVESPKAKPEKNTVPLSPFGQSTKKGSETPAAAPPVTAPPVTAPATGLGATGLEVPIGGSGVTGLEGGDFPYTLYITGMQRRIGTNWFRPQVSAGAAAIIYFRIQRNGTIGEARVEQSSGNATFDRAALSAVRSSNPLTPLPSAYVGNWLGVHLTFR